MQSLDPAELLRASPGGRRAFGDFLFAFVAIFAGFALPSPGLGPVFSRLAAAAANFWVTRVDFASGVRLFVDASAACLAEHPFQATLHAIPPGGTRAITVPIDLRTLAYLPLVTFVALAVAVPLGSWRRNARLLALGLALLLPLLALLIATPLVSFLGGTGPLRAFALGRGVHVVLQLVYRALVVPPAMAYALPLGLFAWLVSAEARAAKSATNAR